MNARLFATAALSLTLGAGLAVVPIVDFVAGPDMAYAKGKDDKGKDDKDRGRDRDDKDRGRDRDDKDRGRSDTRGNSGNKGNATNAGNRGQSSTSGASTTASRGSGNGSSGTWVPPGQEKKTEATTSGASRQSTTTASSISGDDRRVPPGQAKKMSATETGALADSVAVEELDPSGKNIRARMGALNAAHASENALANASPNSRVGRIAAYRDEVLYTRELADDYVEARDLLETLDPPEREIGEIEDDLAENREDIRTLRREIADLEEDVDNGDADPSELEAAREDLRDLRNERRDLRDELTDAEDYGEAEMAVEDLADEILLSVETSDELLDYAANKPVTPDVEDEVQRLLGLDGDPLADVVDEIVEDSLLEDLDDDDPVVIVVETD
ncbi:hypothetical protein ACW9UR_13305 [Halovulum sp. GXIMD14794]